MLANLRFTDLFSVKNTGISPTSLSVSGTFSGSAMQLGGSANQHRHVWLFFPGEGTTTAGVVTMYLMTATASAGTYTSLSASVQSYSISAAGIWAPLVLDTDNSWFNDLGTNAVWVKPVLVVTGVAVPGALACLGYDAGSLQGSLYNDSTLHGLTTLGSSSVACPELDLISG
jgi:hypothetical protein